jgi:hypothetical protein
MSNTATATVAKTSTTAAVGLFPLALQIGDAIPGALTFTMHLVVNTPQETVTGFGNISQSTNPPVNIETKLDGTYTYMTVMPKQTSVLIVATGYPIIVWPPNAGIGPVILPNVEVRIVLDSAWEKGTASYKYQDANGTWHNVSDAPVKRLS